MPSAPHPKWREWALQDLHRIEAHLVPSPAELERERNSGASDATTPDATAQEEERRARCLWIRTCIAHLTSNPLKNMRVPAITRVIQRMVNQLGEELPPARIALDDLIAKLGEDKKRIENAPRAFVQGTERMGAVNLPGLPNAVVKGVVGRLEQVIGRCERARESLKDRNALAAIGPLVDLCQDEDQLRWADPGEEAEVLDELGKHSEELLKSLDLRGEQLGDDWMEGRPEFSIGRRVAKWHGIDKRSWEKRVNTNLH